MLSAEEQQSIRKALLKVPTDGWRHVGEHTDEMGNTSNWIVAGDYANEGEPDLVIEVWGTEDDSVYADFVAASRYLVPKLLDYINELESMPLVQTVVSLQKENKRLKQAVRSYQLSEYKYRCSGCGQFTKYYNSRGTCRECHRVGYLSGSFKREDLEKWFDERQALEGESHANL